MVFTCFTHDGIHMFYWYLQEGEGNSDGWETVQKKPTKRHQQVIALQLRELIYCLNNKEGVDGFRQDKLSFLVTR